MGAITLTKPKRTYLKTKTDKDRKRQRPKKAKTKGADPVKSNDTSENPIESNLLIFHFFESKIKIKLKTIRKFIL